ncbi:MAG: ACP S-malonyltransferase [Planctomycetes bacterium]|nr:ACP S-malonyltransferase [Planctomycetota bacterium]
MRVALLFPGQGAQHVGMGKDWCEASSAARATFELADRVLGFGLSAACWREGEEVNRTDIAQPGIFTTSVAIVRALEERGWKRDAIELTAGLSLGEYTALWFAGSLSFEDGLRLVRLRGEAMQAASEQIPSTMLSLMGATEEQARALAGAAAAQGICQVANLNAPGQVVLSGELAAITAAEGLAKDHGIRRTRRLVVAGGFHSECMRPAARRLEAALRSVEIRAPRIDFLTNVTGDLAREPQQIRAQLADQVCASVLWERSMRRAIELGAREFCEPGPGSVLCNLLGKIDATVATRSYATPQDAVAGA